MSKFNSPMYQKFGNLHFKMRVKAVTGKDISEIQTAGADALLEGQILATNARYALVTVGYPVGTDEDGVDVYGEFAIVDQLA